MELVVLDRFEDEHAVVLEHDVERRRLVEQTGDGRPAEVDVLGRRVHPPGHVEDAPWRHTAVDGGVA
jgi:hypothetical protein